MYFYQVGTVPFSISHAKVVLCRWLLEDVEKSNLEVDLLEI